MKTRIIELSNKRGFEVQIKKWYGWTNPFYHCTGMMDSPVYFCSFEKAKKAIEDYLNPEKEKIVYKN